MQQLTQILSDFSAYTFTIGDHFRWSSSSKQITYKNLLDESDVWALLHEIGHAELGHADYLLDVQLLNQESVAWEQATILARRYDITIPSDYIEDCLDTYRLWLHNRSSCPKCGQNGFQTTQNTYNCSNCRCLWRVNEARLCQLRRVRLPSQSRFE